MDTAKTPVGPDFASGVPVDSIPADAPLLGHLGDAPIILVKSQGELFAVGAICSHYSGPLDQGLVVGDQVRCPLHHACFSLRTGEPLRAPALLPIPCFDVEVANGKAFVRGRRTPPVARVVPRGPASVVIVGAGAAGNAAAETLRREGYAGSVTMIGMEEGTPVDRPNLSKDYLAGNAPEEWLWLHDEAFYREKRIERIAGQVVRVDSAKKEVALADGRTFSYGALLLATGATPVRLSLPGADLPHVRVLRSVSDSRQLVEAAKKAKKAVVIGASFIGLEAAAALRARGLTVDVVAPEEQPLERIVGPELAGLVKRLHEEHGVHFHLRRRPATIDAQSVTLDDGTRLSADLVVMGVGVRPATDLAEQAGCRIERGVVVDGRLQTTVGDVFAAGDIARFPDPRGAGTLRIEHWVVAERMGQHAARSLLGASAPFSDVPFFWSQHYDAAIQYLGHAERWDGHQPVGVPGAGDGMVGFREGQSVVAVAAVGRDSDGLRAELALESRDQAALDALLSGK